MRCDPLQTPSDVLIFLSFGGQFIQTATDGVLNNLKTGII